MNPSKNALRFVDWLFYQKTARKAWFKQWGLLDKEGELTPLGRETADLIRAILPQPADGS